MATVYGLFRPIDNVIRYVGITTRPINERFREHCSDARLKPIYPVHHWMAKYNDVEVVILHDSLTSEQAKEIEIKEIANRTNLLNLSDGGEGFYGYKHTEDFKKRLAAIKTGIPKDRVICPVCSRNIDIGNAKRWHFDQCGKIRKPPANKGVPMSDKQKAQISQSHKGKTISQEQRAMISAKLKGRTFEQLTCPHCHRTGNKPPMIAWHFDKCKLAVEPPSVETK
jgi:ribosomal protein L37AE/L43A